MAEHYKFSVTTGDGILLGSWNIATDTDFAEEEYENGELSLKLITYEELDHPLIHQDIGEEIIGEIKTHLRQLEKDGV